MNLSEIAGITLTLNADGTVSFPDTTEQIETQIRFFSDASRYYTFGSAEASKILYRIYRDVCNENDRKLIEQHDLRYDVVSISPGKIGAEFIKTNGHYHPRAEDDEPYPEIYEVLHGSTTLLLQDEHLADAIAIEAGVGAQILIPPGYGHITINTSDEQLVFCNVISRNFTSIYSMIKRLNGGVYYLIEEDTQKKWVKNPDYSKYPVLKHCEPGQLPIIIGLNGPLYTNLVEDPYRLSCLNNPRLCPAY